MKVTIYTIAECPFCTQEKEYLTQKGIVFEEKNVATHKEFLQEMLGISDNFAGVPFTHVVKDDGSEVGFKGFTKEEFEQVLFGGQAAAVQNQQASTPVPIPASMPVQQAQPSPSVAPIQPSAVDTQEGVNSQQGAQQPVEASTNNSTPVSAVNAPTSGN